MNQYGICNLSVIPVKSEPSHKSETVSQLLFGECFEILDQKEEWARVKLAQDDYEGWVDIRQTVEISVDFYKEVTLKTQQIADLSTHAILMKLGHDEMLHLLPGSTLPAIQGDDEEEEGLFKIGNTDYMFLGLAREPDSMLFTDEIEEVSRFYLNTPYLWGGRSLYGIDCSGFTQIVYKHFGIKIPRDAYQQAEKGETVNSLQSGKPGDLVFFDREDGKITHVGILINDSEIIHASGKVRVDKIDERGIFNLEQEKYTHKLRSIKRILL